MGRSPNVRRATERDLDVVVEVLVESHVQYVWEQWALPVADRRERLTQLYHTSVDTIALRVGEVWMTDSGDAVAVWLPSGAFSDSSVDAREAARAAEVAFGDRIGLIGEVDTAIARARPRHDWLLATMGTLPAVQRRGLGSAVLQPRLEVLDAAVERAVLETSDAANVDFYARFDFEVVAELDDLPHGAPTTWLMVREPSRR